MKKSFVLAITMTLGVTASAYAANPFTDVPAGHWTYDSVSKLAAAGIIEGYGDDTFRGERLMTRYEMAQIVAKALAKGANVNRLAAEFADELDALGVRVSALEKKSDNVKITGQIRYSYAQFKYNDKADNPSKTSYSRLRTNLVFTGKVNDNWSYATRLENNQYFHKNELNSAGQPYDNSGEDQDVEVNRAFLKGRLGGLKVLAGRTWLGLGKGMIYDSTYDGISVTYGDKVQVGGIYGKLTQAMMNKKFQNDKTWGVNTKISLGKKAELFGEYDKMSFKKTDDLTLTNAGLTYKFGKDVALTGMWMHTNADKNNNGAVAILDLFGADYKKPGTSGFQAIYYNQPARSAEQCTMEGDWWSNDLWDQGFKGYSLHASHTVAKNMVATLRYFDIKSREEASKAKNRTMWSELKIWF